MQSGSVCWLVALVALLASPRAAAAQIVNVQGALAKPPAKDGLTGELTAKVSWREGNNPIIDVGGIGSVVFRHRCWLGLALARGEYGKSRGVTLTRKTFEHVRGRRTLSQHWRWEAFGQHEYDQFRRLSLRAVAGTGPAIQVLDRERVGLLVGASYLLEYERLDRREGTVDAGSRTFSHRASVYVTGHEDPKADVSIVQTIYVQPRFADPTDLRLLGELAVQHKLTTHLALKDSLTVAYDSSPPDGIQRYDTALEIAVTLKF